MPKESTILLYNSSTTGNAPSAGDLNLGELAVNTMDEKVFLKNLGGTVLSLSQTKDLSGNFARLDKVVYSLNGLTGTLSVTGTANEIEVNGSFPNIVVGLRDSVTINNLTVTTTVTAENFVGSLMGKVTTPCKNMESYTLTAGTPVYISGYVGAGGSGLLEVKAALAGSAAAMPAVGLVEQTLAPNDQGDIVELGLLGSLNTSGYNINQVAFVAEFGGLTSNRPSGGSVLVQNIGRVVNSSSNQGQIIVLGPGRSNDVPNNITVRGYLEMPNGQTATSLVTTFNGASGAILYSPPIATASVTGVASFNSTYFSVSSGAVSLASAYQATGDTVITTAGSGIAISTTGRTDTLFNIGVTSFNGATGAVSYAPPLASASVTGVAHFPNSDFAVSATGSVTLSNVARTNAANTFTARQTFSSGITTSDLWVSTGATFGSRASFPSGITASQLFVSTGATFGSTINAPNIVGRWSVITADQTAEVNNGYLTNKGTLLVLTLPTTAAVGSMIRVSGMNAGLWKIAQNASQVIHFGKTDTTTGTSGYLLATQTRDSVELVCCVANNEWNVLSSVGNIDYA